MPFVCRLETGRKFALFNNITSCMLHAVFVQTALPAAGLSDLTRKSS